MGDQYNFRWTGGGKSFETGTTKVDKMTSDGLIDVKQKMEMNTDFYFKKDQVQLKYMTFLFISNKGETSIKVEMTELSEYKGKQVIRLDMGKGVILYFYIKIVQLKTNSSQ